MDTVHGPVMQPAGTQRTAITASTSEKTPGIERMPLILPDGFHNFEKMMGFDLPDPKRFPVSPQRGREKTFCHRYYLHIHISLRMIPSEHHPLPMERFQLEV